MPKSSELSSQRSSIATTIVGKITAILTGPYSVAAIASLSFHAVLFTAIPRFSSVSFAAFSEEDGLSAPRTVPLVTLSAADQARLPDFSPPQLPSIPDIRTPRPSVNNLPNASIFNRSSIFDRSNSRLTTPSSKPPNRLSRNRPFRNPYTTPPSLSIRNTPSRSEQSSDRRTAVITDIPQPPPSVINDTSEDTLARELELEQQLAAADAEQTDVPEGLPELPEASDLPADDAQDGENLEIAANTELTPEPSRLERLTAKFKYDPTNTTVEEVEANYQAWQVQPDEDSEGTIETAEIGELTIDAEFNLCAQTPPINGEIGVLVAPDGTPSKPTVLRSTGYDYLNQAALDTLMSSEFPETENIVRYPFELVVNYDDENCRSAEEIFETVRNNPETPVSEE